ncbi:hypothetical protein C7B09_19840 [Escherichia albertii]|uniref:Uncharacterized protein n=1 Tax=Escherichia albertii TaxID=208962 RepID=A0ABX5HD18_ESCAL|nr:hypothetical protein [Escherichia albertii]PSY39628.1 hypothetical protein C7B09_19840 [Escherichia albertii]
MAEKKSLVNNILTDIIAICEKLSATSILRPLASVFQIGRWLFLYIKKSCAMRSQKITGINDKIEER